MTQLLTPTGRHKAADIPPAWLHQVRAVILRDGHAVRQHASRPAIEVQCINDGSWCLLNLPPALATDFETREDRDAIYDMLTGRREPPEMPE